MKCVPVHHGIPAVLLRDEPWLHRHSENGALGEFIIFVGHNSRYQEKSCDIKWCWRPFLDQIIRYHCPGFGCPRYNEHRTLLFNEDPSTSLFLLICYFMEYAHFNMKSTSAYFKWYKSTYQILNTLFLYQLA